MNNINNYKQKEELEELEEELLEDFIELSEKEMKEKEEKELDKILNETADDFFGKDVDDEVLVFVEIGRNSNIKYEYDSKLGAIICDRILSTPVKYFFNYGFIKGTKSDDGDELDAVVLIDDELLSGCFIKCKIIGCLNTSDNEGDDPKMIVVPISKVDKSYDNINSINDIEKTKKDKLKYFFTHYKDLESGKFVNVNDFVDKKEAIEIYKKSKI